MNYLIKLVKKTLATSIQKTKQNQILQNTKILLMLNGYHSNYKHKGSKFNHKIFFEF